MKISPSVGYLPVLSSQSSDGRVGKI